MPSTEIDEVEEKAVNPKKTIGRLIQSLMQQKHRLILVLILGCFCCVLNLISPIFIGKAIDNLIKCMGSMERKTFYLGRLQKDLLILFCFYIVSASFNFIQQWIAAGISENLTLDLRNKLSLKMQRLPIRFYDSVENGEIMSRVTNDLERVADVVQQGFSQVVCDVITLIAGIILMFVFESILAIISIVFIATGMAAAAVIADKAFKSASERQKKLGEFNSKVEEYYSGIETIKLCNGEEFAEERISSIVDELSAKTKKNQFYNCIILPFFQFSNQLGYVILVVTGVFMVIRKKLSLGGVQVFLQYYTLVSDPVGEIAYLYTMFQSALASAERVFDILEEEEMTELQVKTDKLEDVKGNIVFDHVSFSYEGGKNILEDVSIDIKQGEKVALVGTTGAGKTTLVNLLMGFYKPDKGRILIDGTDINYVPREELHKAVGMVLQETWMFEGSIYENIGYGKENATEEEVKRSVALLNEEYFIKTLPDGYDTRIIEGGTNISQGQKQLIAIARIILANCKIVVLDEATANMDMRTEALVQDSIDKLMQDKTSVIIAHRLQTVLNADKIIVLEKGKVLESGTHQILMNRKGKYYSLYTGSIWNGSLS